MVFLLLLLAAPQSTDPLMTAARARLSVPCEGAECATTPRSPYRIDGDDDVSTLTSKDRAIGDDGSKCNVVGARRCTKRGRTLLHADLNPQ